MPATAPESIVDSTDLVALDEAGLQPAAGWRVWLARRPRDTLSALGFALALATSLALAVVGLLRSDAARIGEYGLIQALHPAVFVGLAGLNVGFGWLLFAGWSRLRAPLLGAHLVGLSVILNAAPYAVERVPRFPVAYLHAGFAEYVQRTGGTLPGLDARFSWPGFFAAVGALSRIAGIEPLTLVGLFSAVAGVAWLLPLGVLSRELLPPGPARWLAVWLFCLAEWTGQSYFAPQAVAYFLFLVVVAIVVTHFADREGGWAATFTVASIERAEIRRRPALLGLLLVTYLTIVVSHQLTPFFVITAVGMLALAGRTVLRGLPFLLAVIFIGYVSFLAVAYWSGHLHTMISQIGHLSSTVDDSVAQRVRGGSAHRNVVYVRLLLSGAMWTVAVLGLLRRLRRRSRDVRLAVLAGAPFLLLLLQSYGGEGLIRIYLFSLPFAAGAATLALLPSGRWNGPRPVAAALVALLGTGLCTVFLVARYGGEQYESIRPRELTAVRWTYQNAPPGSLLTALAPSVPWRYTGIGRYEHAPALDEFVLGDVQMIHDMMAKHAGPAYLIVTRGEGLYAAAVYGTPADWRVRVERQIQASRYFRLVYANPDARIYALVQKPPPPPYPNERRQR